MENTKLYTKNFITKDIKQVEDFIKELRKKNITRWEMIRFWKGWIVVWEEVE